MDTHLDSQQLAAVKSQKKVTVVIAGPGSGKTRTLTERIKWLVGNGADPREMAVMTFTNAGANELRERLGGIKLGFIGTLHGFCFRMLQRYGSAIGYRAGGINLLSEQEADEMLKATAEALHWRGSNKQLLEGAMPLAKTVLAEYRHTLKRNNLVDYDGALTSALELIQTTTDVRFSLPAMLFVDEFQDSATIDGQIYDAMQSFTEFIVGDTDQSIFSFRGANPGVFLAMARVHQPFFLEQNYRSGPNICRAASALIGHNTNRIPKAIVSHGETDTVTVTKYKDSASEMRAVSTKIIQMDAANLEEVAVLCRTNEIADNFRNYLDGTGVRVRKNKPVELPHDWGYALNVMKLFNDPRNDIVAEKVMREYSLSSRIDEAKRAALANGSWLSQEAARLELMPVLATHALENLIETLGVWKVSKEALSVIAERMTKLPEGNRNELTDLLHDLYNPSLWSPEETQKGVHVGTVHGAKGREWDCVFLPAWEDGSFPKLTKDADIEEERRLAFVAITRARQALHISYAEERRGKFKADIFPPSRFIGEAGLWT